jgi:hypothetical protein
MNLTFQFKNHSISGRMFWSSGASDPAGLATPVFVPQELLKPIPGNPNLLVLDERKYLELWAHLNTGANPTGIGSHTFPDLNKPLKETDKNNPAVRKFLDNLKPRLPQPQDRKTLPEEKPTDLPSL